MKTSTAHTVSLDAGGKVVVENENSRPPIHLRVDDGQGHATDVNLTYLEAASLRQFLIDLVEAGR